MRRYEILLEFLSEETDLDADVAAQHMLYDLYLRENLRSVLRLQQIRNHTKVLYGLTVRNIRFQRQLI